MELTLDRKVFDPKSILVCLLCTAGAAVSIFTLYQDMNASGVAGLGEPLAAVVRRESSVRRKAATSYLWSNVNDSESLYKKDSIQTGPGSAVSIKMKDGSVLELAEDSLIVMDTIENISLNFVRGQIVVRDAKGTDKRITVDETGKAKTEEITFRLTQPEPFARYFVPAKASKQVTFQWETKSGVGDKKAFVEISPDKTFKSARVKKLKIAEAAQAAESLVPGKYFWRVTVDSQAVTETRQFSIASAATAVPLFPLNSEKVTSWGEESPVQFRWKLETSPETEGAEHRLEVAKDAEFSDVVAAETIAADSGSAALKKIPVGSFYWRITSKYSDVALTSRAEKFVIQKPEKLAIELSAPDELKSMEINKAVRVSWTFNGPEAEYAWEIEAVSGGGDAAKGTSVAPSFNWTPAAPGVYKWRILATTRGHTVGESTWRQFSIFDGKPIALTTPAPDQSIQYWDEPAAFSFTWQRDAMASESGYGYRFELAQDSEFRKKIASKELKAESVASSEVKLTQGIYFWRVALVNSGGQVLKTSQATKFTYGVYPSLRAPASVTAEANQVFNVLEMKEEPTISWNAVDEAKSYELTIKAGTKVILTKDLAATTFALKELAPGKYHWSVRAIDRIGRKGEASDSRNFEITQGELLPPPLEVEVEVED